MRLFKNIGGVTFANILNAGVPFLLLPVLTSYLPTAEFGALDIFYTTMSFLIPLVGLNFYSGITVFYNDQTVDNTRYVGTSLSITVLSAFVLLLGSALLYLVFPNVFLRYYVAFIILVACFKVINETLSTYWLMEEKILHFGLFKVVRTVLELLVSILMVVLFLWGVSGRVWAISLVSGMAAIWAVSIFMRKYKVSFIIDKRLIKIGLLYSIPLIFHSIGGYILNISDRYFIAGMVSDSDLGIYSAAYQVGMVFYVLQISFNQAWVPYFMRTLNQPSFDKIKMVKYTYLYALVSIFIFALLWLCVPVFYYFIGEEYQSGQAIVPWVLLAFLFNGFYLMVVNYLFVLKKTLTIAIATIVVGLINLALNYFFIQIWGIKGAAISTALSFGLSFLFFWIISNRYYPMPWTSRKVINF